MRAHDIAAITQFRKVKEKMSAAMSVDTVTAIQEALNKFDFDKPYELLQAFGADANS